MEFAFTPEQEALRAEVQQFIANNVTPGDRSGTGGHWRPPPRPQDSRAVQGNRRTRLDRHFLAQ